MDNIKTQGLFNKEELKSDSNQAGYFQSLLQHHNKYMSLDGENEDMIRENEMNFVQGLQSPTGPLKFMTEEAKAKVH